MFLIEGNRNVGKSDNDKESKRKFQDPSVYQHPNQMLRRSILGQDTSSVQVWWKSVQYFFCNPAYKPTNKQTNKSVVCGSSWGFLCDFRIVFRDMIPLPVEGVHLPLEATYSYKYTIRI